MLHCLRTLALSGVAWLCGAVLHNFDTPSLHRLYVDTKLTGPNLEDDFTDMFPARFRTILARNTRLHIGAEYDGFLLCDLSDVERVCRGDKLYNTFASMSSASTSPYNWP